MEQSRNKIVKLSCNLMASKPMQKVIVPHFVLQFFDTYFVNNKIKITCPGFLSFYKINPDMYKTKKRTYDLVVNDSGERPTLDDQRAAFKKLTRNSDFWYDRTIQGKLQPRTREQILKDMRQTCKICGMPLFEQPSRDDPNKKVMACEKYPKW